MAFIFKLVIGGAISYILPSVSIPDIKDSVHYKISIVGILSVSLFSVTFGFNSIQHFSLGAMIIIGLVSYLLSDKLKDIEKITLFSCVVISIIVGMGYIFQGIILSFLVYYLTINRVDLFSLFKNEDNDAKEEDNNNKKM